MADIGLLILRVAVGATMLQAGLIKVFDFNTTATFMETGGWRLPESAAFTVLAAETAGGALLLLGLLTPLAACAVIAAMLDAWAVNVSGGAFWSMPFNVPFMVAVGAAAVLFTGPGALSLDAPVRASSVACADRDRAADRRDRRRDRHLGPAQRRQPDPLQRSGGLTSWGAAPYSRVRVAGPPCPTRE
ncbi:MAG: DoxX family protein [Mycobacterium sp.]|nr:DoxX family protein [Mycobacterium sp.]